MPDIEPISSLENPRSLGKYILRLRAISPFRDIVKSRRARDTRGETRKQDGVGEGVGGEKGELATMSHKFSFPPGNSGRRSSAIRGLSSSSQSPTSFCQFAPSGTGEQRFPGLGSLTF